MPKNLSLSRHLSALGLVSVVASALLLSACGQKGALYLEQPSVNALASDATNADTTANNVNSIQRTDDTTENANVPTALVAQGRITTHLMSLDNIPIRGTLAQLDPTKKAGWLALLNGSPRDKDLLRYVVFDGDVLDGTPPLTVLTGHVQNKTLASDALQREINGGYYLRIRSLETGVSLIPSLMATAKAYLAQNPMLQRKTDNRSDFLIESNDNIDLYISVEETP